VRVGSLLVGALGLTLGIALGSAFTGGRDAAPAAAAPTAATRGELTRLDVAAVVRAELARAPRGPAAAVAPAPVVDPDPQPEVDDAAVVAPEVLDHAARATAVLDQALARGQWTDADGDALRAQIATLPSEQAMPIMVRMSDAVTRGELALATDGMPL